MPHLNRRKFLFLGMQLPVAAFVSSQALAECGDPDNLSSREQEMRDSMEYTDAAPDPKAACRGCSFFTPEAGSSCGGCQILGGQVNRSGHCVSWTKAE